MEGRAAEAGASRSEPAARPLGRLSPGPGLPAKDVAASQLARIHRATTAIVAERGYQALKIRDVVSHAELSTRAFYEHFGSKEDCFLQTHELISRRAARRIFAAQAEEPDWRKRPQLIFERLLREIEGEPDGARVALVEAYDAGDNCLEQVWKTERLFEGMLADSFARKPAGVAMPPLVVEGIMGGVITVARDRLRTGEVEELRAGSGDVVEWVLSFPDEVTAGLGDLDRQSVWRDTLLDPAASSATGNGSFALSSGDRALILTATAKLAAARGYAGLTAARIRSTASVSRKKFDAYFDGVEDCYLAALEQKAGEALAQAARAQAAASSWAGGVYRAIAALCDCIAGDAFLARVCLADDFPPGSGGARSRRRLIAATLELLSGGAPRPSRPSSLVAEASAGAVWSVFHRHVIRDWSSRRQVSATLSYLALAPVVGASEAVAAIQSEQGP